MSTYKVKPGDGWSKISKNTGVPLEQLLKLNNATTKTMLHPDQELILQQQTQESPGIWESITGTFTKWFDKAPEAEPQLNLNRGRQRNKVLSSKKAVIDGEVVDECSKFGNCTMRDEGYIANGHAWTRHNNQQTIYSGFNTKERPKTFNLDQVVNYNLNAADNVASNFDINSLDKDSMYSVGMYYMGSPAQERAYNEGTDGASNTHTGNLSFDKELNDWVVKHNIHGTEVTNRFKDVLGSKGKYGVTGVYKPHKDDFVGSAVSFIRGLFQQGGKLPIVLQNYNV